MVTTDNRRVRMTKRMIKDAYLELLEKYPAEKISVTEICKSADVNRSTFYMYYEDTVVLRREIETEVLEQIPVISDLSGSVTSQQQFLDLLEHFFAYIQENERLFRILLLQSDNRAFNRRLIETVLDKYDIRPGEKTLLVTEYAYIYCVSGVIGILGNWIEDGFPISAQQFAELALKISLQVNEVENV